MISKFRNTNPVLFNEIEQRGVVLSAFCPLACLSNPLIGKKRIITNSGKLRNYSNARYFEEAVVTHEGVNTLAVFMKSIILNSKKVICYDRNNRELFNQRIDGKILCFPDTIGSTTAGLVYMTLAKRGISPAAMLFSKSIDSLAEAGVLLSDIWLDKQIFTVDRLGDDFLNSVSTGQKIEIKEGGVINLLT